MVHKFVDHKLVYRYVFSFYGYFTMSTNYYFFGILRYDFRALT